MKDRTWMPLYVGDYLGDTAHLNAAQHGAYLLLILHYWRKGSLPDDDAQLAQIARMTPLEWKRHRPVIRAFFQDGWRHTRIDTEIRKAKEKYDRRANAGKKGNEVRWGKSEDDRNAIAMGSHSQSHSQLLRNSPSQEGGLREGTSFGDGLARRLAVVGGSSLDREDDL